jgi:hypothetical protein
MLCVEAFGLRLAQVHHAGSNYFQAGFFEAGIDLANHILGNCIGFDDGQSTFDSPDWTPGFPDKTGIVSRSPLQKGGAF